MKKIFYLIIIIIFILLFSCSSIYFWSKINTENNFTKERLSNQYKFIKKSNPEIDSFISHLLFDDRLVGVTCLGISTPGVKNDLDFLNKQQSKDIWGTTDVNTDQRLYCLAFYYAYRYNINLLKIIKKTEYLELINEKDLKEITEYIDKN